MIKMTKIDDLVIPEELCNRDDRGNIIYTSPCGDCSCDFDKSCEADKCIVGHVFKEYAKITGQIYDKKEDYKMTNMLNGMFGKVQPGMYRLSMNGGIAVRTTNGYKSYNLKSGRLTNCSSFVFNIGEEFFFVIPTNKVKAGDIILVSGKPKCVVESKKNMLTVINYEDSTVENILPERHVFMGNTYFYGKIVSMFGSDMMKGKKGTNKIIQYMMMSEMMKGNGTTNGGSAMSTMLPFMMMGGKMGSMFEGMFDSEDEEDIEEFEEDEEE